MKKVVAVALSLFSLTAFGSDWRHIGGNDSKNAYMDFSSIVSVGQFRKAWIQTSYASPREQYVGKTYSSERFLFYFDCSAKTIGGVQQIRYANRDWTGEVIASRTVKFTPAILDDVVPDTNGEHYLKIVCASPAERARMKPQPFVMPWETAPAKGKQGDEPFAKLMKRSETQQPLPLDGVIRILEGK